MKFNDAVLGAFFIALGGLLFYLTRSFPPMPGQAYGPDLFPRVIGGAMALAGAVLVMRGLAQRKAGGAWAEPLSWMGSSDATVNFVLVVSVLVFYILCVDRLGFLVTGFICLTLMLLRLRGLSGWPLSMAISLATILLMQGFFGQMLRVPLPWGVLRAYAW